MIERILSSIPGFAQRARIIWENPVVEFFSMRQRLAAARAEAKDIGVAKAAHAISLLRDAHQMGKARDDHETALNLYRDAARLLMSAELRRAGAPDAPEAELWDRARELGIVEEPLSLQRALSSEEGEAYLAALAPAARSKMLEELRGVTQRLADRSFENATRVERTTWTRRFRVGGVALVLLGMLSWSLRGEVVPRNLAFHRPVTVSDLGGFGVDPSLVVDGNELNLGFHTGEKRSAFVTIDLGNIMRVKRVVVFNRIDCCQERAVPLLVQLSYDGVDFTTVAKRDFRFQEWDVTLPPNSKARYVRLFHNAFGIFHLAEIKVF